MLELARAKAAGRQERLAGLAAELSGTPRGLLTDSNRSLMTGMLRGLVGLAAEALRARLAARPQGNGRERTAAAEVAADGLVAPLRRVGVLTEPALIEAAYHRLLESHLAALARERAPPRTSPPAPGGSAFVSDMFARTDPAARQALTSFMVGQTKRIDAYGNALLAFEDVPDAALGPLFWAVAASYRMALAATEADGAALDAAIEDAAAAALAAARSGDPAQRPAAVAGALIHAGLADAGTLAPLLGAGEIALFEAIFGRLAGIDAFRLRRFLFEPGGEALAVCARAIRLARDDLAAILAATAAARQRPRPVGTGESAAALALYDRVAPETVARLMGHWARGRDFLWMLDRLDGDAGGRARQSTHG